MVSSFHGFDMNVTIEDRDKQVLCAISRCDGESAREVRVQRLRCENDLGIGVRWGDYSIVGRVQNVVVEGVINIERVQ